MLPLPMQDSLPTGGLAFAGRESNPLDRNERFPNYISSPFPEFTLTLPAHDRGHEPAQPRTAHPGSLHPWLQEAGSVLAPLARHGDRRGHPALSAASRRAGGEHLHPQPYDDGRSLPVPSDAATA